MKITIIGAGNVGASAANFIAINNLVDEIVLLDVKEGIAEGKALDISQSSSILNFHTKIYGACNDYKATKDSDIIIITSGKPRAPGMTREDLTIDNYMIVTSVAKEIEKYSKNPIIIVVSNPLDSMTYAVYKTLSIHKNRVMGMSGTLDTARFKYFLQKKLSVNPQNINAFILGGHGDTMLLIEKYCSIDGIPLGNFVSDSQLKEVIKKTVLGGGEIVNLLGRSGWICAGAAIFEVVRAIVLDERKILPVSAFLEDKYGISNSFLGVPVILGRTGIEEILELDLTEKDMEKFMKSAKVTEASNRIIDTILNKVD